MEKIEERLDNINKTLEKILTVMEKKEPPILRIVIIGGLIAAFLSIIDHIDTIIKWLKEGLW